MSIRITARPENGIRRVGLHHPAAPVIFPDEYFEAHEVEILKRDPDLIVELLDDELLTSGERHHLHLLRDSADVTGDLSSKPNAQPGAGHAPSPTSSHGPSAEQQAAEGEGRETNDDSVATRDLILLLGDYDATDAAVLLDLVQRWTPEERLSVEQYCSAMHLASIDHEDVHVPQPPAVLGAAIADVASLREARADAKRAGARVAQSSGKRKGR